MYKDYSPKRNNPPLTIPKVQRLAISGYEHIKQFDITLSEVKNSKSIPTNKNKYLLTDSDIDKIIDRFLRNPTSEHLADWLSSVREGFTFCFISFYFSLQDNESITFVLSDTHPTLSTLQYSFQNKTELKWNLFEIEDRIEEVVSIVLDRVDNTNTKALKGGFK